MGTNSNLSRLQICSKFLRKKFLESDRLKENGKHSTVAQIAVMRKLIVITHSLYKNNTTYKPEIYKKACGVK